MVLKNEKTCAMCGKTKIRDDFNAHPTSKDKLQSYCKSCLVSYRQARKNGTIYKLNFAPRKRRENELIKTCRKCDETKESSEYNYADTKRGIKLNICRACQKAEREHYKKVKAEQKIC